ncbi:flavin reductase [Kitasatospora sp. NPDC004723]|uniref:flavin reductase family protein n=1 Tax=Kitasatospora sp. NPDC004723 TaxID=3154288 RepID=UPI0033A01B70
MGDFETFAALLVQPVYMVTAPGPPPAGCLVAFAGQCSIDPVRFVVWIPKADRAHDAALAADALGVHLLPYGHGPAALFGGRDGEDTDRFAGVEWYHGPYGVPVLAQAPAWFVGRVLECVDWGDHTGLLLAPVAVEAPSAGAAAVLSHRDVDEAGAGRPAEARGSAGGPGLGRGPWA